MRGHGCHTAWLGLKIHGPDKVLPRDAWPPAQLATRLRRVALDYLERRLGPPPTHDCDAVRQAERRRLRRDLHDTLAPVLAVLHMRAEALELALRSGSDRTLSHSAQLRRDLAAAIATLRLLIGEPSDVEPIESLSQEKLGQFLENQARIFDDATAGRLRLLVEIPEELDELPASVQLELRRAVGEAIANVARHASASECRIVGEFTGNAIELRVADNGRGLPHDVSAGVGLPSMCARARELGGSFSISNNEPRGTVVRFLLPWPALSSERARTEPRER